MTLKIAHNSILRKIHSKNGADTKIREKELLYYTEQSYVTDPGHCARLFENLPRDICGLAEIVQGLIVHYNDKEICEVPKLRWNDIDLRYVDKMLARIMELDDRPLNQPRPFENRLVGCCRDYSVLFCAMARYNGIPARTRAGFAAYFKSEFNCDHEVVEYWDADSQTWKIIDPELGPQHLEHYRIKFEIDDVPHDQFLHAGTVWRLCRTGQVDPEKFCLTPDTEFKGLWYVGHLLAHDFARLNKQELLLWDRWGSMPARAIPANSILPEDLALLDKIAYHCSPGSERLDELNELYEQSTLKVPKQVESYSPVLSDGAPRMVALPI